jgi:hypothetical protein
VGDLDMWSFDATAGDAIMLAVGEVGANSPFIPWIRLKSPTGQNLGSQSGALAAQIEAVASVTGTYTVVVSTFDSSFDASGSYTLTLAKAPGAFTIAGGDEGGTMTNGSNHTGVIHVGDLDMWSFNATAGEAIMLAVGETGGNSELIPWIRLKSPTGQNLGSQSGALAAQIEAVASVTGTYTVVVSTFRFVVRRQRCVHPHTGEGSGRVHDFRRRRRRRHDERRQSHRRDSHRRPGHVELPG